MPQTLSNRLSETGKLRLMPKMLALMTVQRQTAASRSTNPSSKEQQGKVGGDPSLTFTSPSTSAHTPNLSASLGQVAPVGVGVGVGQGFGFGFGGLGTQPHLVHVQALPMDNRRRLARRKRAKLFEAMIKHLLEY